MCSPSAGELPVNDAGVAPNCAGWRGKRVLPDDVMVVELEQSDRDRVRVVGELGGGEDHRERDALGFEARGRVRPCCATLRARSTAR